MNFYGFFQTDVLINFPSRLCELKRLLHGKTSTRQSRILSVQKRNPALPGRNFLHKSQDIIYEEFITLPGSWQNETESHPGQPES